eukprot:CAMPEP_0113489094 /NCGR_PEP_ID=MMETSP0014_2-20120614/26354_1 /TAXON_ID=2857 /ORGANISM="Nitzschia sp." /LENGTH=419 /DNA_ID=CAMNT_0000382825 /DNA_START=376 /DNA_END=1635 /DNA_ORIENTATION=+ /assembly_acc=CAM_ASM_000159
MISGSASFNNIKVVASQLLNGKNSNHDKDKDTRSSLFGTTKTVVPRKSKSDPAIIITSSTPSRPESSTSTTTVYSMTAPFSPTSSGRNLQLNIRGGEDNKYAKRKSQMERLHFQYRNQSSSQRFVMILVVTALLSFVSFWILSSKMSAGYAGREEDVRSLQDLADSIRRVRLRRQQALGSNGSGSGSINSANGDSSDGIPYHTGGRQIDRHSVPLGSEQNKEEQMLLHQNHLHDEYHDDGEEDRRPTTSLHHSRRSHHRHGDEHQQQDQRPLSHGKHFQYRPSDHCGDRFRERFPVVEERRWKSDEESQLDEELRLESLESAIRASHEGQVHEEVRTKRLEEKMDATIEALKDMTSHHDHHNGNGDGSKVPLNSKTTNSQSVGGKETDGIIKTTADGKPLSANAAAATTTDLLEEESFT